MAIPNKEEQNRNKIDSREAASTAPTKVKGDVAPLPPTDEKPTPRKTFIFESKDEEGNPSFSGQGSGKPIKVIKR